MRRSLWLVLAAAWVGLAGCSSGVSGEPQPATPDSNLADALAVVPASAGSALAVDQAAMKQRWGAADVNSSSDPDSDAYREYLHHLTDYLVAGDLVVSNEKMREDYGWNYADVDWAVESSSPDDPPARVYKLRDTLDMTVVTTSMDDHYQRSGPDSRPVYKLDLKNVEGRPPFLLGAVVIPDQHLVIDGADPSAVLAVIDGTAAGFGETPTAQQMLVAVGDAEGVIAGWGASACQNPGPALPATTSTTRPSLGPDAELDALGTVTWTAVGVSDETHASASAGYPDATAAAADTPRRDDLVTNGTSRVTRQPYTEILGPTTVSAAGDQVRYRMDAITHPTRLVSLWSRRDAPWAFCGSG